MVGEQASVSLAREAFDEDRILKEAALEEPMLGVVRSVVEISSKLKT